MAVPFAVLLVVPPLDRGLLTAADRTLSCLIRRSYGLAMAAFLKQENGIPSEMDGRPIVFDGRLRDQPQLFPS